MQFTILSPFLSFVKPFLPFFIKNIIFFRFFSKLSFVCFVQNGKTRFGAGFPAKKVHKETVKKRTHTCFLIMAGV